MNDMLLLQMLGGGSGLDLTALLAFVAFSVVYLVVPVIGYRPRPPAAIAVALYFLIGYGALSLIQLLVQWSQVGSRSGPGASVFGAGGDRAVHQVFVFAVLKAATFLASLVAFVTGLRSLRLREPGGTPGQVVDAGLPHEERFRTP
jgi:hypothetical protein